MFFFFKQGCMHSCDWLNIVILVMWLVWSECNWSYAGFTSRWTLGRDFLFSFEYFVLKKFTYRQNFICQKYRKLSHGNAQQGTRNARLQTVLEVSCCFDTTDPGSQILLLNFIVKLVRSCTVITVGQGVKDGNRNEATCL